MASIFCSKCGTESAEDAGFCSKCGTALIDPKSTIQPDAQPDEQPPTVTPIVQGSITAPPSLGRPYGTPGTGALWLSILGIISLGITAFFGVFFGVAAIKEAKRHGVSNTKGVFAVVIGSLFIVPYAVVLLSFMFSVSDSSEPATTRPSASSQPSAETMVTITRRADLETLRDDLLGIGFKCTPPSGTAGLSQCSKGEVDTAAYGKMPAQTVNIEFETGAVHGSGKPKTLKTIGKYFTVEDFGDDGTGGRLFGT